MEIELSIVANVKDLLKALNDLENSKLKCDYWRECCASWKERYPVNDGKPFPDEGSLSHYQFFDTLSDFV